MRLIWQFVAWVVFAILVIIAIGIRTNHETFVLATGCMVFAATMLASVSARDADYAKLEFEQLTWAVEKLDKPQQRAIAEAILAEHIDYFLPKKQQEPGTNKTRKQRKPIHYLSQFRVKRSALTTYQKQRALQPPSTFQERLSLRTDDPT